VKHTWRNRSASALNEMHYGPNMTPMVDVVMVILIFFMASAVVLGPEFFVQARLPKSGAVRRDAAPPPTRLTIRVERESGRALVRVNDAAAADIAAARGAIIEALGTTSPADAVVVMLPSDDAPYEEVVRLHALCKELGLTRIALGEPPARGVELPD